MKNILFITALLFCAAVGSFAQKQSGPLPYNKEHLDSLFRSLPKSNQPFVLPVPKGYTAPENTITKIPGSFEAAHHGATVINRTARGIVYNMPLDNMAVLVPDMHHTERMPGSSLNYKPATPGNMPNPLYPGQRLKKK